MKRNIFFLIFTILFVFISCKKDEPAPVASVEVTDLSIEASYTEADIQWSVTSNASVSEVVVEYSTDSTFAKFEQKPMDKVNPKKNDGQYKVSLTSLVDGTTYYVRTRAINKYSSCPSATQAFNTKSYLKPTVRTDSISVQSINSIKLYATLLDFGTDTLPQVGFYVAKHADVTIADSCIVCSPKEGKDSIAYSITLDNLLDNTTYYVRAFAKNHKGVAFGQELSYRTVEVFMPTVGNTLISDVSYTTATIRSEILSDGGMPVLERGFCYSTSGNPTILDTKISAGSGLGSFSCNLESLTAGTTYYARAYASNHKGTSYGDEVKFTTDPYSLPVVSTSSVTNITYTTATCGGNVSSNGGLNVTERGVCYSTTPNPTIANTMVSGGEGVGSFVCKLTNLTINNTYYVRAYATNSLGTAYGEDVTFTIPDFIAENGVLPGEFSVSATKKVHFSQGNLQYQASTNTWRFAEHQYDFVGGKYTNGDEIGNVYVGNIKCNNSDMSSIYSGWIDLFGWGTSGYDNTTNDPSANNFQPWCWNEAIAPSDSTENCEALPITGKCEWEYTYPSTTYNQYGYGPSTNMPDNNLIGTSANYDWGIYNAISNGGNQQGLWRTLSNDEWNYIISGRPNAMYLMGLATVNGVFGLILLSDDFTKPSNINWQHGCSVEQEGSSKYSTNVYSLEQWQLLQSTGAVFLPCTDCRRGRRMEHQYPNGYYWSSSCPQSYSRQNGCCLDFIPYSTFNNGLPYCSSSPRFCGNAVRLVQDVQ